MRIGFSKKNLFKWALLASALPALYVLWIFQQDMERGYHWLLVLIACLTYFYAFVICGTFLEEFQRREKFFVEVSADSLRSVEPDKKYEAFIRFADVVSYEVYGVGADSSIDVLLNNGQRIEIKGYKDMDAIVQAFLDYPGFQ
ncbi:MAG: hypothetical protein OIF55_08740 [Amphritea sp.]|nr:hypothetical protein [Amphritea sp.]